MSCQLPELKAWNFRWENPPQFLDTIAEGIKTQQVYINFVGAMCHSILSVKIQKSLLNNNFSRVLFEVGQKTFPLLCDLVQHVVTVTDPEMAEGCRLVAERMKVNWSLRMRIPFRKTFLANLNQIRWWLRRQVVRLWRRLSQSRFQNHLRLQHKQ